MIAQVRGPLGADPDAASRRVRRDRAQLPRASSPTTGPTPSHLTEFYFWVSFGGMLGGLFNTLAAPLLFNSIVEYPLVVVLGVPSGCAPPSAGRCRRRPHRRCAACRASAAADGCRPRADARGRAPLALQLAALTVPALLTFAQRRALGAIRLVHRGAAGGRASRSATPASACSTRRARSSASTASAKTRRAATTGWRTARRCTGCRRCAGAPRREALTYYHSTGPFGQAWRRAARGGDRSRDRRRRSRRRHARHLRGRRSSAGRSSKSIRRSSASRGRRRISRSWTRAAIAAASSSATRASRSARVPEHAYDLLVLDAFSSDSIPMHLMTREAFALYLSRLAPGGALVMHISNRHLRLAPIVARLAASQGLRRRCSKSNTAAAGLAGRQERRRTGSRMAPHPRGPRRAAQRSPMVAARAVAVDAALDRRFLEHPERARAPLRGGPPAPLLFQREHRVDAHCAPRRPPGRQQGHTGNQRYGSAERGQINSAHPEED